VLTPPLLSLQGAAVHSFDPDATPQQKAQQALKGAPSTAPVDMSALPSLRGPEFDQFKQAGGTEMATDIGSSGKQATPPTTSLKEVEAIAIAKEEGRIEEDGVQAPPGAMPAVHGKVRESE
jgi:hypothetical protein